MASGVQESITTLDGYLDQSLVKLKLTVIWFYQLMPSLLKAAQRY